ncbi:M20 family peptidase [Sneathiella limimaris]|uniref:M20 family peptidase n=1 Tax=Sneathiella limimaris TaxID=1964213 RepID=UPI00146BEB90|nr:M20 family peptidase [Sneathiella limimaris]
MFKKLAILIVLVIIGLVGVIGYNTVMNTAPEKTGTAIASVKIDEMAAANRLAEAVRIKTISYSHDAPVEADAFDELHALIETSYPTVAEKLEKQVIGGYSLLYKWEGRDPDLPAAVLMGHLDVVPVEEGTEQNWEQPPFSGAIVNGAIWGRGTLDDKVSVFGLLEAAEYHLKAGLKPKQTIYLAFGHDEEIGGDHGAGKISKYLADQGVKVAYTLDEGMVVVNDIMPGVSQPIAFIALAEKGYLTVELTATAEGGHSSIPPRKTAVGKIARAIARIEDNRLPAALRRPVTDMFETLSPYMPLSLKAVISNRWLLDPVLVSQLGKGGATNAMVRTTTAATIIQGGTKDNVLPSTAKAVVNFRILPGSTVQGVIDHVTQVVDDPDVKIEIKQGNEPSKVSDHTSGSYRQIKRTIEEVLPDVLVSPGLMLAGSDSKHYEDLAENSYRFIPMRFGPDDLGRVHGTNERILIKNYGEIIRFYIRLMENTGN